MESFSKSIKLLKHNIDFVYEELVIQFLNKNGGCHESTFYLINWNFILDSNKNRGIAKEIAKF
jgi:hypothetical protein